MTSKAGGDSGHENLEADINLKCELLMKLYKKDPHLSVATVVKKLNLSEKSIISMIKEIPAITSEIPASCFRVECL